MSAQYLADTSVIKRIDEPSIRNRYRKLTEAGLVATCYVTDVEAGRSALSPRDWRSRMIDRAETFPWVTEPDDTLQRVWELHKALALRGQQRGVGLPDLMIAVTAAFHDLTVLHYDHDFDLIAGVTGQSVEWIVPRGTVN